MCPPLELVTRSTDLELDEHPVVVPRASTMGSGLPTAMDGEVETIASSRHGSHSTLALGSV